MNPYDLHALTHPDHQTPLLNRGAMPCQPWNSLDQTLGLLWQRRATASPAPARSATDWEISARRRRRTLLLSTLGATVLASMAEWQLEGPWIHPVLQGLQWTLFTVLFAWITLGFITAVMGFVTRFNPDPHALMPLPGTTPLESGVRTAVVMPICNEQVATVFAGLRATCESLLATGTGSHFDFFVLSDSNDPLIRAQELVAWHALRNTLGPACRLYYRVRQRRTRRKAGNLADFFRRWGKDYRYAVVLDADSVMSGESLVTLTGLMESQPRAGIIQTAPRACGMETLHARSQQFSGRVSGPLFTAGMQYWQLGESHYWGHNAILRVEPFMAHCGLALLPGEGNLAGEILSHDFVEAALMRRAGYEVWVVPGLEGSYEQQPAHLLDELQRDRRWCQGNLKNIRLLFEPGFAMVHRAMLLTGVMAYASAPLWLIYLALSFANTLSSGPAGESTGLLPVLWPVTLSLLFLPRLLALIAILARGEATAFGGAAQLIRSAVGEAVLSAIQAPIRMTGHTLFVITALTGFRLEWKSPAREATDLSWISTARHFLPIAGIGLGLSLLSMTNPHPALLGFLAITLPLTLAAPLTVITSRARMGRWLRAEGWMVTPEELKVPRVLRAAGRHARRAEEFRLTPARGRVALSGVN